MTIIRKQRPIGIPTLMDDLFNNEFFHAPQKSGSIPAVNIKEIDTGFELDLAAPGLKKEEFSLKVHDNTLTVSTKHEESKEETNDEGKYTRKEFSFSSFSRSFNLPEDVDQENIQANYKEGVLKVFIPRKTLESKKVKEIEIA